MICSICKTETEGIRLNGKLFCPSCGSTLQFTTPATPSAQSIQPEDLAANQLENQVNYTEAAPVDESLSQLPVEDKEQPDFSVEIPQENNEPVAKIITPEGELTSGEPIQTASAVEPLNQLEAEEEVLSLLEKLPESKFEIKKSERERTDRNSEGFMMIKNEPDPIEEPELPVPEDILIEKETEEELTKPATAQETEKASPEQKDPSFDVIKSNERNWEEEVFVEKNKARAEAEIKGVPLEEKGTEENVQEKTPRSNPLTKYLKHSVQNLQSQPKKKKKKNKTALWIALLLGILTFLIVSLIFYVNLYALNPSVSIKKARQETDINFNVPSYIPEGYRLSNETTGNKEQVSIVYQFINNPEQRLSVNLTKVDYQEGDLFQKVVKEKGQSYLNSTYNGQNYWYIDDRQLIFLKSGVVYEITSSVKMSVEELFKIAEGVMLDNNLSG